MNKNHPDYTRYEAIKYDLKNGARLPNHKIIEFEKLQLIFEIGG